MASTDSGPFRIPDSFASKFFDNTTTLPEAFRELLEKYGHIAPERTEQHVIQLVSVRLLCSESLLQFSA